MKFATQISPLFNLNIPFSKGRLTGYDCTWQENVCILKIRQSFRVIVGRDRKEACIQKIFAVLKLETSQLRENAEEIYRQSPIFFKAN